MLHTLASAPRRRSPPSPAAPSEDTGRPPAGSPDPAGFDDTTLLAVLLRGRVGRPAEMAEALLDRFGALGDVLWANRTDLARLGLAGEDLVVDLAVLQELAVRIARAAVSTRPVLGSSSALQAYARAAMAHRPREQFRVLFLDHRNRLLADEMTAEGTIDHAPVYNSGPDRVARLGRVPDIAETRQYVTRVLECFLALTAGRSVRTLRHCAPLEAIP